MNDFDTIEKLEEYLKQANCYGEYNYCFTAQPEDKISTSLLMTFGGAVGGALAHKMRSKEAVAYILNKNEKGIAILPIVEENKKYIVVIENTIFLNNEDIEKVVIKNDAFINRLIRITTKDKSKYKFKTAKDKNIDYHEINLKKFIDVV